MKPNIVILLSASIILANLEIGNVSRAAEPPKNVISMEQARTTALKKFAGTVKGSELEQEAGKWIYSFDILGKDRKTHEIWIDARNGKFLKHEIESAAQETKEQETEH